MLLLFRGGLPVGALAGGTAASAMGVRGALAAGAAGLLATAVWLAFPPVVRVRTQE